MKPIKKAAPRQENSPLNNLISADNCTTEKLTLRQQFKDDFSNSAFQRIDDEQRIVGKYGEITQFDDGSFDVWFIGPNLEPLSTRRLNSISEKVREIGTFTMLEGEGYARGRGRDFVLFSAALAGVKKKKRVSESLRKSLSKNLAEISAEGAGK